jgi:type II secretory pathway component GspD/PulD (secretin)
LSVELNGNVQSMSGSLSFKGPRFEAVAGIFGNLSDVSVVTSPSALVESGSSSELSVGSAVPVLGAIQYNGGSGQSQQSVQYRDTGVILRVSPRIFDDSISLDVAQEISDAVTTTTGVTGSPTLNRRAFKSTLNVSSGQYVVMGGLASTKRSAATDFVPFFDFFRARLGGNSFSSSSEVVIVLYVERT